MRAVVLRQGSLVVDEVAEPVPAHQQSLVRVVACGICGSDLHFVHHGRHMTQLSREGGSPSTLDVDRDIVMGHEFVVEVLEHGPGTQGLPVGSFATSMPIIFTGFPPGPDNVTSMAYSNIFTGGYGERMLVSTPMLLAVPNGLVVRHAALTEPMAVGIHAVARSAIVAGESALVHGCGPVGLAVIAALRLAGVEVIVAADFSPVRRALAARMGATTVVDPAVEEAIDGWKRVDGTSTLVQFEAIGLPGILNNAMKRAPRHSRIVVVGVCMQDDMVQPIFGINKELTLQFVLGYTPEEFSATLDHLAEGRIEVEALITGSVGLAGVADAFAALAHPDQHVKILVEPER